MTDCFFTVIFSGEYSCVARSEPHWYIIPYYALRIKACGRAGGAEGIKGKNAVLPTDLLLFKA